MYLQVKSNKIRDSFIYINHLTHCCKFSIKFFDQLILIYSMKIYYTRHEHLEFRHFVLIQIKGYLGIVQSSVSKCRQKNNNFIWYSSRGGFAKQFKFDCSKYVLI